MTDQPLQPFAPPQIFQNLPGGAPASDTVIVWLFYFALVIWIGYTLIAIYHWIKYSHAARIAVPAILLHLFVSFILVTYALTGAISLP